MTTTINMNMDKTRFNMIEQQIHPWEILNPIILNLLSEMKHEDFVPTKQKLLTFANVYLPLNNNATMLEPKIEAHLLQELGLKDTDRVLEISANNNYIAALLATHTKFITSIEIEPALIKMTHDNLQQTDVTNINIEQSNDLKNWTTKTPYNTIAISDTVTTIPDVLLQQLHVGGQLVAIVGSLPSLS